MAVVRLLTWMLLPRHPLMAVVSGEQKMPDRTQDILRHFPTLLQRWEGAIARLCELTCSHQTLTIRLEQNGRNGNLQIACIEPIFIHSPTDWCDAKITVLPSNNGFVVVDEAAGVRIETHHVEIAENRKPFNLFTVGDATKMNR